MKIKSLKNFKNLKGRTVFLRADFNVPVKKGKVIDDYKIISTLPTIRYLLRYKCKIVIATHLGDSGNESLSVKPIAAILSKILNKKVRFSPDCIGEETKKLIDGLKGGEIVLLENLRAHKEEKENGAAFAKKLASSADIYVNDAFGVSHRKHASLDAIKKYLPAYAGLLLEKEILSLNKVLKPKKPLVVVMGGLKFSTKLPLLKKFGKIADYIILGGGLANTLLYSLGYEIGNSVAEKENDKLINELYSFYRQAGDKKILLPIDLVLSSRKDGQGKIKIKKTGEIGKNDFIYDIGPKTISFYSKFVKKANTIIWNGPLGLFENKHFRHGTFAIAQVIAARSRGKTFGVTGGGETNEALKMAQTTDYMDWVSTGGGAMLSYLSGEKMPGLDKIIIK